MEQGLSRDSNRAFRTGYFDCDYAHERDGTFVTDTPQHKCFMVALQVKGGTAQAVSLWKHSGNEELGSQADSPCCDLDLFLRAPP